MLRKQIVQAVRRFSGSGLCLKLGGGAAFKYGFWQQQTMQRNAGDYVKSWGAALIRGAATNPEFTVITFTCI